MYVRCTELDACFTNQSEKQHVTDLMIFVDSN